MVAKEMSYLGEDTDLSLARYNSKLNSSGFFIHGLIFFSLGSSQLRFSHIFGISMCAS